MRSPVEEFYIKIGVEVDKESLEEADKTTPRLIVNKSTVEQKLLEALLRAIDNENIAFIDTLSSAYQRLKSIQ